MQVTIDGLESYLAKLYGSKVTEQGLFMKLVEEMGEVAEALNKRTGRKASDGSDLQEALGKELADVIHYAVAIAAVNGLDLNGIILRKDRQASVKYHHDTNLESFLNGEHRETV
ncbi:MAG: MazG nucleotide pyrophosphohydrolase domain-containing protein [Faecousia sp.]